MWIYAWLEDQNLRRLRVFDLKRDPKDEDQVLVWGGGGNEWVLLDTCCYGTEEEWGELNASLKGNYFQPGEEEGGVQPREVAQQLVALWTEFSSKLLKGNLGSALDTELLLSDQEEAFWWPKPADFNRSGLSSRRMTTTGSTTTA